VLPHSPRATNPYQPGAGRWATVAGSRAVGLTDDAKPAQVGREPDNAVPARLVILARSEASTSQAKGEIQSLVLDSVDETSCTPNTSCRQLGYSPNDPWLYAHLTSGRVRLPENENDLEYCCRINHGSGGPVRSVTS
jgi:hypothetical protein